MAQYKIVRCTINGKKREQIVDVRASLTDMIRNNFHLTSVKKGCEVGECGACTVLIDGEAINSCLYLAVWAEGKEIITLEGLMNPDRTLSVIQKTRQGCCGRAGKITEQKTIRGLSRGRSCTLMQAVIC